MKKLLLSLLFSLALSATARATDINIGPTTIPGFNPANLTDVTVTASVTFNSPTVTCSSCFRQQWVGLGGFRVAIQGVPYTVAYVSSKNSLTLTTNYAAADNPSATILWYKYVELRIYADSAFQPFGETYIVQPGAPGSGAWHRRVAASVVNELGINNLYIPQIMLDATTDSLTNQGARYYAAFYRPEGAFIQTYECFDSFALPPTGASTWPDICLFNQRQVIVQDDSTYNKTQIDSFRTGCTIGQSLFYAATGLKPACLNFGAGLSLVGDTLSATPVGLAYTTVLEEGTPLTQRSFLNFIGSSFTAADNAGASRTEVTADADLNALASNATNGFWAAGTNVPRTLTGTANRITITNGNGTVGNPVFDIGSDVVTGPASATDNALVRFDGTTGKLLQNSAVTVADTTGNFAVPTGWTVNLPTSGASVFQSAILAGSQTQSSGVVEVHRIETAYDQTATAGSTDLRFSRVETTLGSGEHNFIKGAGGAAGSTTRFRINNLGNYFFGATGGFIGDENSNEYLKFSTSGSAVNELTLANAATGSFPTVSASGSDSNIDITLTPKGTGKVGVGTPGGSPVAGIVGGPNASGSNIAGVALDLHGGKGTGNAVPGQVNMRYPLIGASGSTLQSLSANAYPVATNLYTNTVAGASINNTTAETSLFATPTASAGSTTSIEGGISRAGTMYKVRIIGNIESTASPTLRVKAKLGSTILADTTAATVNTAGGRFWLDVDVLVNVIGATGTVTAFIRFDFGSALTGAATIATINAANSGTVVDFTSAQTLDVTVQWGTANALNALTAFELRVDRVR